jgi:hypothetical protein
MRLKLFACSKKINGRHMVGDGREMFGDGRPLVGDDIQ